MKFQFLAFWVASTMVLPLYGQFSDDFSDGNLDGWQGDFAHFIVNGNEQLQLNAPSGSTSSFLYTPVSYADSMVWEIYFRMNFAPSTSNQLKIYLGINSTSPATASGYFLEVGASGDQDALELKYLSNGIDQSLVASVPALVASDPVELTIRVIKKNDGTWQCYKLGGVVPELLFSTSHDLLPISELSFFGVSCKYTDTRRDKFFFDNVVVEPYSTDTKAPICLGVTVLDPYSVSLLFDEPLEEASVIISEHYLLTPGNTNPVEITANLNSVTLRWSQSFINQTTYSLAVRDIQDLAGNTMVPDIKEFTFIQIETALPFELLITEIMADPTPVIGLPDVEYLEIYNSSGKIFRLSDYLIRVGSSDRSLPDELIYDQEYIIICSQEFASQLSGFGRVIGLSSLPALTNSGTNVSIKNIAGTVIHEVRYQLSWYGDPGKTDGGWSLEMRNPLHICQDAENWSAANNLSGGTPGKVNSQWNTTPDMDGPGFISLYNSAPDKLQLRFDENLDAILMENPSAYSVLPSITISNVVLLNPKTIEITFSTSLETGVVYTLQPFDAYDCIGNLSVHQETIAFGLVMPPTAGDLLINEILFNPGTGGSRFIELINVSQKFISLNSLSIARISSTHNDIYSPGINEVIGPGELAVFTPNPSDILFRYQVPQPSRLYTSSLPSWSDKTDQATLIAGGVVLDSFTYSSSWHHPVIADQNGVSLERISVSSPATSASTWHSASAVSGYATPTGSNSQVLLSTGELKEPFTIINKVFSPNDDGYKDFLALNFLLTEGDLIGSVWIYDLEGREINQIISNASLGTSAVVQWDGRSSTGLLADMGMYIVFVQLWDAQGQTQEYKKTCALVKR